MLSLSRFALVAVCAACVAAPTRAAEVDALLPKETEFVIQINVKQMLESDIIKKYAMAQMKMAFDNKDAAKVLADLGLDPFKDIDRVTIGFWDMKKDQAKAVFIARGTFDAKKILETAGNYAKDMADKISIVKEGELELIKFTGEDGKPGYIAVQEGKPLIAGTDKAFVLTAFEAHDTKAKPALSKELTSLVLKQDAKASLFFCGITEGMFTEIPGDFGTLKRIEIDGEKIKAGLVAVKSLSFTIKLGKEVNIAIKMSMKDNDSADDYAAEFGKLANAAKTLLPLATLGQEHLQGVIDDLTKTLNCTSKDKEIIITGKFSGAGIAKAVRTPEDEKDK